MRTVRDIEQEHRDWLEQVATLTGASLGTAEVERVLELARLTAHDTARPLAPLATYALGVAVARGQDPTQAVRAILQAGSPPPQG